MCYEENFLQETFPPGKISLFYLMNDAFELGNATPIGTCAFYMKRTTTNKIS